MSCRPAPPNGSTPNRLKIFGDIHDDGNMVYVEFWCDTANGRLYRNSMPISPPPANKPVPGVEQILIDNIEANPDGTPCFTYQTKTVTGTTFVVDVAITLTVRTQQRDKNTNDFQRETKALLNVSPRNVFNTWQMASLDIDNRVQPTPASVTGASPGPRGSGCRGLPVTIGDVMTRSDERGIALVVALFMVLILSVLGSSLVFVSRTETLSSLNYKTMSQTRYGAESGVHRAANHLLWTYVPPANPAELALFDVTTSPVRVVANGRPVVLSTHPGFASNYPTPRSTDAFVAAAQGNLAVNIGTVAYNSRATLLAMRNDSGSLLPRTMDHASDLGNHRRGHRDWCGIGRGRGVGRRRAAGGADLQVRRVCHRSRLRRVAVRRRRHNQQLRLEPVRRRRAPRAWTTMAGTSAPTGT